MQIGIHLHIDIPNPSTNNTYTGDIPEDLVYLAHRVTRKSINGSSVTVKDKALETDNLLDVYLTKDDKVYRLTPQGKPSNKRVQSILTRMLKCVNLANGISDELRLHELTQLVKDLTTRVEDLEAEVSSLRLGQPIQPAWPPTLPQHPQPKDHSRPWYRHYPLGSSGYPIT